MTKEEKDLVLKAIKLSSDKNVSEILKDLLLLSASKPSTKINLYDLCLPEKSFGKDAIKGIFHDNGYVVATDGFILAKLKDSYGDNLEQRVIGRDGKIIEDKFPNYKLVIPNHDLTDTTVNFKQVREAVKRLKIEKKADKYAKYFCKIGHLYFDASRMNNFANICEQSHINRFQIFNRGYGSLLATGEDGSLVLLMPYKIDDDKNPNEISMNCN